jgi:spermidine synthase
LFTRDYETIYRRAVVRRDATATVIAAGEGMKKQLLVNGYGMTTLTTITKCIAHLPLAFLPDRPRNALVICFGMGTSFRSATTWDIPVVAVELIPSVPQLFDYFHTDAAEVLRRPGAKVVVDDGRRYLERTKDTYDVILIDPPPPVQAAGSSLLYSKEFYTAARRRLRPGGILQQWFPGSDARTISAVARSLKDSFGFVRAFSSYNGWGVHFLASDQPIPRLGPAELASKLPPLAATDMVEWEHDIPAGIFGLILKNEWTVDSIINADPSASALTDNRPVNEYYLLHQYALRRRQSAMGRH